MSATIRETFFDLVLNHTKQVEFNPKNQAKLVSAVAARDWIQVCSIIPSAEYFDLTKPPNPMTAPEQILYDVLPCFYEVFDLSAPMNSIWALMSHLKAESDDEAGAEGVLAKLNIDYSSAGDFDAKKALLKDKSFGEVMKLIKATTALKFDGVTFKAYYNFTSKVNELWTRFVNGNAIWIVADEATMNFNSWMAFRDMAATRVAEAAQIKALEAEVVRLKSTPAAAPGGTSKDKDEQISKLKEQIAAHKKVWSWTKEQKDDITAAWEKIERAMKCCYPDDTMKLVATVGVIMRVAELRGPDAKNDLQSVLDGEIARWDGHEHPETGKNPDACSHFDLSNGWEKDFNAFCDKWLMPGANSAVQHSTGKNKTKGPGWFSRNFATPLQAWWDARVKANKTVRDLNKPEARESYLARFYANWYETLKAPMRAFSNDDGSYSGVSWTVGVMGAALFAPFAVLGAAGNVIGDGVVKLFTGKTLTSKWHGKWFTAPVKSSS